MEKLDTLIVLEVNVELLNLRSQPQLGSTNINAKLKIGETLRADEQNDEWYHVYNEAGVEGYVLKRFVKEA